MKVASSVENIWVPEVDSEERAELVDSLWLSSGASGMKVWLTLSTQVFHNLFWTYVVLYTLMHDLCIRNY